ncbi:MAG: peptidylprolyl isomerase, partial [Microcystaceae cyanobacterium]
CEHNRLTPEQVEDLAVRPLKIWKFQQQTWGDKLESYFLERKAHLDQVSYSLLRIKDSGLAQELYFRLEEGEQSFAELARQYSQGPERHNSGLIGPMSLTMLHPLIAQMLKTSQPGQVLPPTQLEEWIVIVRMEKFVPARLDASMRRQLLNELFQSWLSEQLNQQAIHLATPSSINSPLPQLVEV